MSKDRKPPPARQARQVAMGKKERVPMVDFPTEGPYIDMAREALLRMREHQYEEAANELAGITAAFDSLHPLEKVTYLAFYTNYYMAVGDTDAAAATMERLLRLDHPYEPIVDFAVAQLNTINRFGADDEWSPVDYMTDYFRELDKSLFRTIEVTEYVEQ